jgi:hypothetical protein
MPDIDAGFVWTTVCGHSRSIAGGWLFNGAPPPVAPTGVLIEDAPNISAAAPLGRVGTLYTEMREGGVRAGVNKRITLEFAAMDARFWQFLRYHYVFMVPLTVLVPHLTPALPERCVTPRDLDSEYLKIYYGKERTWSESAGASIFVDGQERSQGFTINYKEGSVTFASALAEGSLVTALYTYSASFIAVSLTETFKPHFSVPVVAPTVVLEEV